MRVILLPFDGDRQLFRRVLSHWRSPALDAGAGLAVVARTPIDLEMISGLTSDIVRVRVPPTLPERPKDVPKAWSLNDISSVAEWCARYDPGPAGSQTLILEGDLSSRTEELKPLFARAFHDVKRLRLEEQRGGLTSATLWRVTATDSDDCHCTPWIVKADGIDEIRTEVDNYRNLVRAYLAFPYRPELQDGRCVQGATTGLLVASFVERAERLDQYLHYGSAHLAIAALFDGPLARWRHNAKVEPIKLVDYYQERGLIPSGEDWSLYSNAHANARAHGFAARPPRALDAFLRRGANGEGRKLLRNVQMCWLHGDLQSRNIFVRRNGTEVVLIDFAETHEGPIGDDPAWLEVTLGFNGPLLPAWLQQIFSVPLSPMLATAYQRLPAVEAMRQVRMHALARCHSPEEYQIALAAALLRYARISEKKPASPSDLHRGHGQINRRTYETGLAYALGTDLLVRSLRTS